MALCPYDLTEFLDLRAAQISAQADAAFIAGSDRWRRLSQMAVRLHSEVDALRADILRAELAAVSRRRHRKRR